MTLTGTTTLGQSGPGSNGNEGVLRIPQSSRTGASPSHGLVSFPGPSLKRITHQQKSSCELCSNQLTELTTLIITFNNYNEYNNSNYKEGRVLASNENSADASRQVLENYIKKRKNN